MLFVCLVTVFLGLPAAFAGDTLYTSTLTPLTGAADDKAVVALIAPGAPVQVIARTDGRLQVALLGWSPEGGEKYLFTAIGQRIRLAEIQDPAKADIAVVSQQEDYYENVWKQERLTGWIAKDDTVADVSRVWQAANTLFHKRCTRCHALHRPTEFKANQWPAILKIMTVRAGLSASDKALVTQFLQTYAKDQSGAPELTDIANDSAADPTIAKITGDAALADTGATLFDQNGCGACHGDNAATPVLPAYPKLAGQSADYVYKQLLDFKSGRRGNDPDDMMKEAVADVPDADMQAMAYWLSTARK